MTMTVPATSLSTRTPPPARVSAVAEELLLLPAAALADHPLLAHIPTWRRDDPEAQALLESIRERGLDYDVLIDAERRIVDGRNRRNACALLGLPVRCRQVAASEAASIIVSSLVNRRHLTKGALAYLVAPLFGQVLEETKARRFANYSRSTPAPETALSAVSVKSAEDIAAHVGLGLRLFEQALKLRRMFEHLGDEVRAKYEPRVLGPWQDESGDWQDPVGLGYMINGLTSLLNEQAGKVKRLGKRAEHARLFFGYLPKLGQHWSKASEADRAAIAEHTKTEVLKWPEELRTALATALRSAARADRE